MAMEDQPGIVGTKDPVLDKKRPGLDCGISSLGRVLGV